MSKNPIKITIDWGYNNKELVRIMYFYNDKLLYPVEHELEIEHAQFTCERIYKFSGHHIDIEWLMECSPIYSRSRPLIKLLMEIRLAAMNKLFTPKEVFRNKKMPHTLERLMKVEQ